MSTDSKTILGILVQIKNNYFQETHYNECVKSQFQQNCDQYQRMDRNYFRNFINNKTDGVTDLQITELFRVFDKNQSGSVNIDEFQAVFSKIRYNKADEVQNVQMPQYSNSPYNNSPYNNQNQYPHPMYNQYQGANQVNPMMQNQPYVPNPMMDPLQSPYAQQQQQQNQQNFGYQQQQMNNIGQNPQQGYYPQQGVANQLIGRDNEQNVNAMVAKLMETNEDPLDSLLVKLGVLKQQHQKNQIDLYKIKNVCQGKQVSFQQLMKFLKEYGLKLNQAEENLFKKHMVEKNSDQVYIKEFFEYMKLKDTYQEQYDVVSNLINPQQQNIQNPYNVPKINDAPFKQPEIQIKPQENDIVSQLINPQINQQVPGNNNNQAQFGVKFEGQNLNVDRQIRDMMMKSTIDTKNFYERDEDNTKGYTHFVQKFKECQMAKKQFTDPEFSPNSDSIVNDMAATSLHKLKSLTWQRPSQFFGKQEYSMFTKMQSVNTSRIGLGKLITPYDIVQGMLGDCYFLSALSSLAQEPQRILNLFFTLIKNEFGIYCVKICYDGEWIAIHVDDNIPCKYDKPAFTKSQDNELWVLILEKAWAKIFKSYYAIEAGYCREALRDLTGAPTKTVDVLIEEEINGKKIKRANDKILSELRDAVSKDNKYVICAGADLEQSLTQTQVDRLGLVDAHAYSIIGVKEINHPQQGNVTLIKLRNPWGHIEWNGDWSDNSNLWTPQLKEKLKISRKDDGIFYMCLKDFQKYFDDVCICYYHDNYQYNSIRVNNDKTKRSQFINLRINTRGKYYISIIQPNKRNFKKELKYRYSGSRLFISQISNQHGQQQIKYIGSSQKRDRELFIECDLEPGKYVIQSKIFWDSNLPTSYVVSTYGVSKTELNLTEKRQVPQFQEECLLQKARKSTKLKPLQQYPDIQKCSHIEANEGIGFYYIKNNSNRTLNMEVNLAGSYNIKLRKPLHGQTFKCVVQPGQEYIAPLTAQLYYSFRCSESFTVV